MLNVTLFQPFSPGLHLVNFVCFHLCFVCSLMVLVWVWTPMSDFTHLDPPPPHLIWELAKKCAPSCFLFPFVISLHLIEAFPFLVNCNKKAYTAMAPTQISSVSGHASINYHHSRELDVNDFFNSVDPTRSCRGPGHWSPVWWQGMAICDQDYIFSASMFLGWSAVKTEVVWGSIQIQPKND